MCAFDSLRVDHVGYSVGDLAAAAEEFTGRYGFTVHARSADSATGARTWALGTGRIRFTLTEANDLDHAAAAYVERHGDGCPTSRSPRPTRGPPSPRRSGAARGRWRHRPNATAWSPRP
ncbi:hypothetical protein NKH77_09165 [Streptomyces sp. M19]